MENILAQPPSFTNKALRALRYKVTCQRSHGQGESKEHSLGLPILLAMLFLLSHPGSKPWSISRLTWSLKKGRPLVPLLRVSSEPTALFYSPFPSLCHQPVHLSPSAQQPEGTVPPDASKVPQLDLWPATYYVIPSVCPPPSQCS